MEFSRNESFFCGETLFLFCPSSKHNIEPFVETIDYIHHQMGIIIVKFRRFLFDGVYTLQLANIFSSSHFQLKECKDKSWMACCNVSSEWMNTTTIGTPYWYTYERCGFCFRMGSYNKIIWFTDIVTKKKYVHVESIRCRRHQCRPFFHCKPWYFIKRTNWIELFASQSLCKTCNYTV